MTNLLPFIYGALCGSFATELLWRWYNRRRPPSTGDRLLSELSEWVCKMRAMNRFAGDVMMGVGVIRLTSCGRFKITVEPLQAEIEA